ncbi:MAG: S1 RNA-binding domain-containing protein [Oscillospiraceae bacterium]|jgi:S1 RNA binding domain protein|nr:S1 RNA-binding domain-containing protein [Oscillospiraceae bacterium]
MAAEVGAVIDGKVTGIIEYGAFVDIGGGKTGMVHISEVAPTYVTNIRDHLSVGQEVRVKVVSVSSEGRVSLSIKKAEPPQTAGGQEPGGKEPAPRAPRPAPARRGPAPNVWQGERRAAPGGTFEDMMSRFKQTSEDKISTLRRGGDTRYGGSSSRKGGRK